MKKFVIVSVAIMVVLIGLLGVMSTSSNSGYENIKVSELDQYMVDNPNYQYVDVRTPEEFDEFHVEGFENILNTDILSGSYDLDVATPVVLICRSGNRSSEVAQYLSTKGYEVINVEDGIQNY